MNEQPTIIGKRYINVQDSGHEIVQVMAFDSLVPTDVIVKMVNHNRSWSRSIAWVQSILSEVVEYKPGRAVFGNDKNAINRHSVREYFCNGNRYGLDRTLDCVPPNFHLYLIPEEPGLCPAVLVDGKQYWGSGITWRKAEEIAVPAIKNHAIGEV